MVDENGIKYVFGGSDNYIEYSIPFFQTGDNENQCSWIANSWYLNRIEDRNGEVLYEFQYLRGKFLAYFYQCIAYGSNMNSYTPIHGGLLSKIFFGSYGNYYSYQNQDFPYNAQLLSPIYLHRIVMRDGRYLAFSSVDSDISMRTIYASLYAKYPLGLTAALMPYVSNYNSIPFYYLQTDEEPVASFQYKGSPYNKQTDPLASTCLRELRYICLYNADDANSGNKNYYFFYDRNARLHLTSIHEMDVRLHYDRNHATSYKYDFVYHAFDSVPSDYLTRAVDHWGYYRGGDYIIPSSSDVQAQRNFHLQRNPSNTFVSYGLLTELHYPTGGKTMFEYEPNQFSKYCSTYDGTIVDSLGYAGGVRVTTIKNYLEDGSLASSKTFSYEDPSTGYSSGELLTKPQYYIEDWKALDDNGNISYQTQFSTSTIVPLSNTSGSAFGYSCVTEDNGLGKKIEYHYSNISSSMDGMYVMNFTPGGPTPYDIFNNRGYKRGMLENVYIYNGDALIKSIDYGYRKDNVENNFVYSSNLQYINTGNSESFNRFVGDIYKIFYPKFDVVDITTKTYIGINMVKDSIHFIKQDKDNLIRTLPYLHKANIRYNTEERHFRGSDIWSLNNVWYFNDNSFCARLAKEQFYLRPAENLQKINYNEVTRRRTEYRMFGDRIFPKYELEWKNGGGICDTLVSYNSYTSTGQLSAYQEVGKPLTTLIWTGNDCHLQSKNMGGHQISFTYDTNWNLLSNTQPNGNKTIYQYDSYGRLRDVFDKNGKKTQHFDYFYNTGQ